MGSEPQTADNDLAFADKERKADLLQGGAPKTELEELLEQPMRPGVQLFGTDDPLEALDRAEALVQRMQRIVEKDRLRYIAKIKDERGNYKDYPKVDWWTSMGFALNLIPRLVGEVQTVRGGDFLATIEVWQVDKGVLVTRAEGFCSMSEEMKGHARWRDEYAARAMAQTRAIGRAFRGPLGGLAALAGLETTPAEEMTFRREHKGETPHQSTGRPKSAPAAPQAASRRPSTDERQADDAERANYARGEEDMVGDAYEGEDEEPQEQDVFARVAALDAKGLKVRGHIKEIQDKQYWKPKGKSFQKSVELTEYPGVKWLTLSNPEDPKHPWAVGDEVWFPVAHKEKEPDRVDMWTYGAKIYARVAHFTSDDDGVRPVQEGE